MIDLFKVFKRKKNPTTNIEVQTASSSIFLDAVKFFDEAGVHFVNSKKDHRHGLSILVDDSVSKAVIASPFMLILSRNELASLYVHLVKDERIGGPHRIQELIRVINGLIKAGYRRGCLISYNIETGKYVLKPSEVVKIFFKITSHALRYSLGDNREIKHLGDVFTLLGGETGTEMFFKEVFIATEASIPNVDDTTETVIGDIMDIRCYTCKYCMCRKDGVRLCEKGSTAISGAEYDAHPGRYTDAHHEDDSECLMSSIIDERMAICDDYECRIK